MVITIDKRAGLFCAANTWGSGTRGTLKNLRYLLETGWPVSCNYSQSPLACGTPKPQDGSKTKSLIKRQAMKFQTLLYDAQNDEGKHFSWGWQYHPNVDYFETLIKWSDTVSKQCSAQFEQEYRLQCQQRDTKNEQQYLYVCVVCDEYRKQYQASSEFQKQYATKHELCLTVC